MTGRVLTVTVEQCQLLRALSDDLALKASKAEAEDRPFQYEMFATASQTLKDVLATASESPA